LPGNTNSGRCGTLGRAGLRDTFVTTCAPSVSLWRR
jgi:hypothetical protein